MMGRSHSVSGLAAGLGIGLFSGDVAVVGICGALGYVTSWLPDFDHPKGKAVRALGPIGWLVCRIIRGLSRTLGLPAHRGLSHTVLLAVLFGIASGATSAMWLSQLSPWLVGGAAAAGVAAALVGDWITKHSLPHLWWPFVSRVAGPPVALRIRTGGLVEKLLIFPLLAAGCVLLGYVALAGK